MVLIRTLRDLSIDTSITEAYYTEGPLHFDEWYALVQEKYPNATKIACQDNHLTKLNCPNAIKIWCSDNQLTELNYSNAIRIFCYDNPNLEIIKAPKLKELHYDSDTDVVIPIELDNPKIYDKNYNILNYNEIVERIIQLKRRYTKSAKKI